MDSIVSNSLLIGSKKGLEIATEKVKSNYIRNKYKNTPQRITKHLTCVVCQES